MVKASQILEDMCFEKEAAARWRKEFGNLSNVAKDTLRRDLVSQPNETAKRLRGQDNMMKKFNIGRVVMSDAQPSSKFEKYILNKVGPAYKKGWFSGAYYDHFSEGKKSPSGNPQWMCSCTIDKIYDPIGEYVCESKAEAKKEAAYEAMLHLVGIGMARAFVDYGKEIKEEN